MNLKEALGMFGISSYEAKAFKFLLEHPKTSAEEISEGSGIPMAKIYTVLRSLEKRGLVRTFQSRPKKYSLIPPEDLKKTLLESKEKELKESEKAVEEIVSEAVVPEEEKTTMFTVHSEQAVWREVERIKLSAKRYVKVLAPAFVWEYALKQERIIRAILKIMKRGAKVYEILPDDYQPDFKSLPTSFMRMASDKNENFRVIDRRKITIPIQVADDYRVGIPFIDMEHKKIVGGMVIHSKELGRIASDYFDMLWEQAAPVEEKIRAAARMELARRLAEKGGGKRLTRRPEGKKMLPPANQ